MEQIPKTYRDSTNLTMWVKWLLYLQIVVAAISFVSNHLEYQLLSSFDAKEFLFDDAAIADTDASNERLRIVALLNVVIFVISAVFILRWIHRANSNAHALGAKNMVFTPRWAVRWFFVPIFSLWKPYQSMKELWKASHDPENWEASETSQLLPFWWTFWLASNSLGLVLYLISPEANGIDELLAIFAARQVSDLIDIPLALFTLILVTKIHQAQRNLWRHGS